MWLNVARNSQCGHRRTNSYLARLEPNREKTVQKMEQIMDGVTQEIEGISDGQIIVGFYCVTCYYITKIMFLTVFPVAI